MIRSRETAILTLTVFVELREGKTLLSVFGLKLLAIHIDCMRRISESRVLTEVVDFEWPPA